MANTSIDHIFASYEFLHLTVSERAKITNFQLLTANYSLDRYFTVQQLHTIMNSMTTRFKDIKQQRRLTTLVIKEIIVKPGQNIVISIPTIINKKLIQKFYYFESVPAFKIAWNNFISDFISRNMPYVGESSILELINYGQSMVDITTNGNNNHTIRMQTSMQID